MTRSAQQATRRRVARWVLLALSAAFVAFVVGGSLQVADYTCSVCITFHGRQACRTVEGPTELDARQSAINNTCAQISSGVTDSIACERTPPDRLECRATR